jgi:metallo-beta-lactamase family protein
MTISVQFLGASETVTGSCYLVTSGNFKLLLDCGVFQGARQWREKNWSKPSFDPADIDAVLLTHAHIDHTGMLPRYYKLGLRAPVYCSPATAELCALLLEDSGRLQEEEASYRAERGRSRHSPPLPLYTADDARQALKLLRPHTVGARLDLGAARTAQWALAGHILGACSIALELDGKRIVFSGDIGRYNEPLLVDPTPIRNGDLLVIESTYGDRSHSATDPHDALAEVINRTARRGGVVIVPSFAIGRTQTLLYYLRELKEAKRIPNIPVIIDSPMARDATEIYRRHSGEFDATSKTLLARGFQPFEVPKMYYIQDRQESVALNRVDEPMIIISASGMLTGGRVLHHLRHRVSDARNSVVFVGFQPPGSRGDWIKRGNGFMQLFGEEIPVKAEVVELSGLSAHADRRELLQWCRACSGIPSRVAVVHGEPDSSKSFSHTLHSELGWNAFTPRYLETIEV